MKAGIVWLKLVAATSLVAITAGCGSPEATSLLLGLAVNSYLKNADVLCDLNKNGLADPGEATTKTADGTGGTTVGQFSLPGGCVGQIVITGGINVDTGLPFEGKMIAPSGSKVVTAATTLVAAGATESQAKDALGIAANIDLLNTDPAAVAGNNLANKDLYVRTKAVQQILTQAGTAIGGLDSATDAPSTTSAYGRSASALVSQLGLSGKLITTNGANLTVDLVTLEKSIEAGANAQKAVNTSIGSVNSKSLGVVSAGTLKSQAEGFLAAQPATSADAKNLTGVLGADRTLATQVSSIKDLLTSTTQASDASLRAVGAAIAQVAPSSAAPVDPNVAAQGLIALNVAKANAYQEAGLPFDPKVSFPYFYNSVNGSFYEFVSFSGAKSYADLQATANSKSYAGRKGHIAAVLSEQENLFLSGAIGKAKTATPATVANLSWIISGSCNSYNSLSGVCFSFIISDGPSLGRAISSIRNGNHPLVQIVPQGSYANWAPGLGFDGGNFFVSLGSGGFWSNVGSGGGTTGFFPGEKWGIIVQYERSPISSTGQVVK
jgi:hypothetical protein